MRYWAIWFLVLSGWVEGATGEVVRAEKEVGLPEGFVMEHVFAVPKEMGSWVGLTVMDDGRLVTVDQYGDVYRVAVGEEGSVAVENLDLGIKGAHGVLWFQDALYVVVNELDPKKRGIYKVTGWGDEERKVEFLKPMKSGGEHGVHSLVPSPDGEWIYFVSGNYNQFRDWERSLVPEVWGEDQLLPRNPDGRGHASGVMAPAGKVMRFRPDGTQWELVSMGYRNPFDGAFSEHGEFFVYDADMEWDMGMPWYRPTRLCWVMPGSEYGWRNGTGKWPVYYEDSLPGVVNFGPGSPVGVMSGRGFKAPARYQKMIFCLDWTFATIYAVEVEQEGAGFTGEWEEFLTASGFPLTDGVIGKDGHMYFTTGGRKQVSNLWRVRYVGDESTEDAWEEKAMEPAPGWDRWSRFAERTEAELKGVEAVKGLLEKPETMRQLNGVIALARVGTEANREEAFAKLAEFDWGALTKEEKLTWLRAAGLVFIRLGEATDEERAMVIEKIDADFPNEDRELEAELCGMLCYLQAPGIVERTLARMAEPAEDEAPDWARLVGRNKGYGSTLAKVLRELGSPRDIHFAYCLRVVKGPWTEGQRRQLMEWYAENEQGKAQKSAQLGLARMKQDTLANATEEERKMIEGWGLEVKTDPFANLPKAKGPGKSYTVEEVAVMAKDLAGADLANGKLMFQACLCSACHRVGSEGGAAGPDLSTVAGRFGPEELAVAILEPSKEISDQYEFKVISKRDGSTVVGKVVDERDEILVVAMNPFDFSMTTEVSRADVKSIHPSPASPMPGGLINQLNPEELRDLLGYLLERE